MTNDKQIDWDKPIQTRDGRPARLLGILEDPIQSHKSHPVIVSIKEVHGEYVGYRTKEGGFSRNMGTSSDIINVPEEYWVNVYRGDQLAKYYNGLLRGKFIGNGIFYTEQSAREAATSRHIKTIKIEL